MNVAISFDEAQRDTLPRRSEAGPAEKRVIVGYGFWIFLLSDIVMFSAFFATYAVLVGETAGGPSVRLRHGPDRACRSRSRSTV